jgi:hypothetical protein
MEWMFFARDGSILKPIIEIVSRWGNLLVRRVFRMGARAVAGKDVMALYGL